MTEKDITASAPSEGPLEYRLDSLAAQVSERQLEVAELKKASQNSEAVKRVKSVTIDANSIKISGKSFINDADISDSKTSRVLHIGGIKELPKEAQELYFSKKK